MGNVLAFCEFNGAQLRSSALADRASRMKRAFAFSSSARLGASTLSATKRPSLTSTAR